MFGGVIDGSHGPFIVCTRRRDNKGPADSLSAVEDLDMEDKDSHQACTRCVPGLAAIAIVSCTLVLYFSAVPTWVNEFQKI